MGTDEHIGAMLERHGVSDGAPGPAVKLAGRFGDDVGHREVIAFYRGFVDAVKRATGEARDREDHG